MSSPKQSELARQGRQKLLDVMGTINWHPASVIARKAGYDLRTVVGRLTMMRTGGEVERQEAVINGDKVTLFRALVTVTKAKMPCNQAGLDAMRLAHRRIVVTGRTHARTPTETDTPTTFFPGRIVHRGMSRKTPLPSGGGQGRLAHKLDLRQD